MGKPAGKVKTPLYVVKEGMCGLCVHWRGDIAGMDAFGNCGMAAQDQRKGERRTLAALPELTFGGALRQQVYDRERAARAQRDQFADQRDPRIVRIEDVSDIPMTRNGETQWEHLRTRAWGSCDRHMRRTDIEAPPTPICQMSLLEVS